MNNPNPFLPQGSFLEQKNKARTRLKIAVFFSISLSVVALMALLIQGCQKRTDTAEGGSIDTNSTPQLPTNLPPETNVAQIPPPETNPPTPPPQPVYTPPPAPPAPTVEEYTVIKGDTFASIAKKSGTTVKAIQEANPTVDAKRLKIGQKLHLPAAASTPTAAPMAMPNGTETAATGGEQTYKVKSGDTLTGIAKHFHVTIKAIQSANNLGTTSIKVGKTLKIPSSGSAPEPGPAPVPAPVESAPPAPMSSPAPASSAPRS